MHLLQGHRHAVRAVAYAPGDPLLLASAGDDRTVRLWDLGCTGRSVTLTSHGDGLLALAFAGDGSLASGGRTRAPLAVWDVSDLRQRTTSVLQGPAVALAFAPTGGALLAALRSQHYADEPGRLVRWPYQPGRYPEVLDWPGDVETAAFAPNGEVLAIAGQHRHVELWPMHGERQAPALWCASRVRCLAFSPCGQVLAVGSGRVIECLGLAGGRLLCQGHRSDVLAVAFAPDGTALLSGSADRTVRLWDMRTGRARAAWDWGIGRVQAVAFAPDGMTAAAGGEKSSVVVWDMDEG